MLVASISWPLLPSGHLYRGNLAKMFKCYAKMDKFVDGIKRKDGDLFLLIVSDHGMKPLGRFGDHSSHSFWSTSIILKQKLTKITDFYYLILDKLEA